MTMNKVMRDIGIIECDLAEIIHYLENDVTGYDIIGLDYAIYRLEKLREKLLAIF